MNVYVDMVTVMLFQATLSPDLVVAARQVTFTSFLLILIYFIGKFSYGEIKAKEKALNDDITYLREQLKSKEEYIQKMIDDAKETTKENIEIFKETAYIMDKLVEGGKESETRIKSSIIESANHLKGHINDAINEGIRKLSKGEEGS